MHCPKSLRIVLAVSLFLASAVAVAQPKPMPLKATPIVNGNTTSYRYQTGEEAFQALLQRKSYTPPDSPSDFEVLTKKKGYTPGGKEYPVAVSKAVPKAAIAKAIGKFAFKATPIGYAAGVFESAADLMAELFPGDNPRYDSGDGRWERTQTGFYWQWGAGQADAIQASSPGAVCAVIYGRWTGSGSPNDPRWYLYNVQEATAGCRLSQGEHGTYGVYTISRVSMPPSDLPITAGEIETKLLTHPTVPPSVDDLLYDLPPEDLQVLANDIAADPVKPIAVPTSAVGTPEPSGVTVPESTTTATGTNSQGQPITTVTNVETVARPLADGSIQHDTKTTTTTTTQTGVDGNGNPVTQTTTSTSTTQTTPTPAEDNAAPGNTGSNSNEPPPTDTPLPPLPELYKQKYPNGIKGVWDDRKAELLDSPVAALIDVLLPSLGSGGTCPSWQIDLTLSYWAEFGIHDVSPPCWTWEFGYWCVIVSALLLARALVFGG